MEQEAHLILITIVDDRLLIIIVQAVLPQLVMQVLTLEERLVIIVELIDQLIHLLTFKVPQLRLNLPPITVLPQLMAQV